MRRGKDISPPRLHTHDESLESTHQQPSSLSFVECAVRIRADGIRFGDDYGSERSLLMSPKTWRRFIKPRLRETFAPAVKAGLDIHFHSCGQVDAILDDLAEIGVNSIWPQLPA